MLVGVYMEILLAFVIVLIIAAVLAVVFFKKKQSLTNEPTIPSDVLNKARLQPTPFQESPAPVVTATSSPKDELEGVRQLIRSQQYDEAIKQLKLLLPQNPKNTAVLLAMLEVYTHTNNHSAFQKIYPLIEKSGDAEAIASADTYAALLDIDEPPQSAAITEPNLEQSITNLDFGINSAAPTQAPLILDEPTLTLNEPAPTLSNESGLDFNLTLEPTSTQTVSTSDELLTDFDNSLAELKTLTTQEPNADTLSFDAITLEPTPNLAGKTDESVLNFDLEDSFSNLETLVVADETPKADTQTFNFDEFDLGLESQPSQTATNLNPPSTLSLDELSFDGLDTPQANNETEAVLSTPAETNKAELNFDDFDFGFDSLSTTSTIETLDNLNELVETAPVSTNNGVALDDLEFTTTSVTTETNSNDTNDGFDFDFSGITSSGSSDTSLLQSADSLSVDEPVAAFAETKDDFSDFDFNLSASTDEQGINTETAKIAEPLVTEVAPTISSFAIDDLVAPPNPVKAPEISKNTFDNFSANVAPSSTIVPAPQSLDGVAITLDLAQQYLGLGEYDSAKHLFEEVIRFGSPEQRQTANTFLKRLG